MVRFHTSISLVVLAVLIGCHRENTGVYKTTGSVEAYQVDIRSTLSGKLIYCNISEGRSVRTDQLLAVVDTNEIHLQRIQLTDKLRGLTLQLRSIDNQENQLNIRLNYLNTQLKRVRALVSSNATSQDKLDEMLMQRDVAQSQMKELPVQRRSVHNQLQQMRDQMALLDYKNDLSRITVPESGVLLHRYVNPGELVQPGHLLATVGLTDSVWVMMYIPETKLSQVQLGDPITVKPDGMKSTLTGHIAWIASEAEFTPKTVYTEDTRTSLTYGVKVLILNKDGRLKIGMPVTLEFRD